MALAATDFLVTAGGELVADWFALSPREESAAVYADAPAKAAALLAQWITKATDKGYADGSTDIDDGGSGVAYVYAAAYRFLLSDAFTFTPAEADVDEKGGYKRQPWQLAELKARLAYWQGVFDAGSTDSLTDAGGAFAVVPSLR
jgi:hypothetical protein